MNRRILFSTLLFAPLLATPSFAAPDARAQRTWTAKCAGCHGDDGKGQTEQGKKMSIRDLSSAAWQKDFSDEKMKNAILNGVNETRDGKKKEMEPFKEKLRPDQVDAMVAFVRSLGK